MGLIVPIIICMVMSAMGFTGIWKANRVGAGGLWLMVGLLLFISYLNL